MIMHKGELCSPADEYHPLLPGQEKRRALREARPQGAASRTPRREYEKTPGADWLRAFLYFLRNTGMRKDIVVVRVESFESRSAPSLGVFQ